MKKLISLIMACTLTLCCSLTTFAADNAPVLTLEKNQYNSNGERHIKVEWDGVTGTYQLQIDDDVNFESPISKTRTSRQGQYYNFVLSENVDATYYVRVRLVNGEWSNIIVASMDELIEDENNPYLSTPTLPKIPDLFDSIKVPEINFDNYDFSKWFWRTN